MCKNAPRAPRRPIAFFSRFARARVSCFSELWERAAVLRQALCVCKCFSCVGWRSASCPCGSNECGSFSYSARFVFLSRAIG